MMPGAKYPALALALNVPTPKIAGLVFEGGALYP